jgi:hypothetical protein
MHEISSRGRIAQNFHLLGASGALGRKTIEWKHQDYAADVYLVSKRILTDPTEWAIFRFHFLQGADWKICCRKLGITRGNFFHAVYRIEERLGRVFCELKPYALFPHDEYFLASTRAVDVRPTPIPHERYRNGIPLRPPLADPRRARVPVAGVPLPQDLEPAPASAAPVVAPVAAVPVTQQVRAWWKSGSSLAVISKRLNIEGIPPARGSKWHPSMVRRMLLEKAA